MPVSRDQRLELARRLHEAGFYTVGEVTMSDDPNKTGAPDRQRINLGQDYEVRDWAEKFGISQDELRRVVERVGNQADDVARELGMTTNP